MTTNSIASYLRIGETFDRPEAPTELAPGEMGTTGGAVARYRKIERHERPVAKKTATAPKKQSRAPKRTRPAKQEPVAVVLELDAADLPQPAERHEVEDTFTELRGQQHANPKSAKATRP